MFCFKKKRFGQRLKFEYERTLHLQVRGTISLKKIVHLYLFYGCVCVTLSHFITKNALSGGFSAKNRYTACKGNEYGKPYTSQFGSLSTLTLFTCYLYGYFHACNTSLFNHKAHNGRNFSVNQSCCMKIMLDKWLNKAKFCICWSGSLSHGKSVHWLFIYGWLLFCNNASFLLSMIGKQYPCLLFVILIPDTQQCPSFVSLLTQFSESNGLHCQSLQYR